MAEGNAQSALGAHGPAAHIPRPTAPRKLSMSIAPSWSRALDAFPQTRPACAVRNPVMFVVYIGTRDDVVVVPGSYRARRGTRPVIPMSRSGCGYVLFANFAERSRRAQQAPGSALPPEAAVSAKKLADPTDRSRHSRVRAGSVLRR